MSKAEALLAKLQAPTTRKRNGDTNWSKMVDIIDQHVLNADKVSRRDVIERLTNEGLMTGKINDLLVKTEDPNLAKFLIKTLGKRFQKTARRNFIQKWGTEKREDFEKMVKDPEIENLLSKSV